MMFRKFAVISLVTMLASPSWGQGAFRFGPDDRVGEWNLSLEAVYQGGESLTGQNGSGAELNDDWGFGFTIGYNFNNYLALGFEMNFLDPSYTYTVVPEDPAEPPQTIGHKASIFNGIFKGTWNILSGPITPFVDLQAGWRYIDSNVASAPPITGCWWDPWWGYICSSFYSTYSDTSFAYGAGLGLRWDITRDMFLRASWSLTKVDSGASGDPTFDTGRLEIGWRY